MRKFISESIENFVYIKHTEYHIPTYDEVAENGLKSAAAKAANEIIDLLRYPTRRQLSMDDFCKIRDLIRHDGFNEYYAYYVYKYLEYLVEHVNGTPICGNHEFLDSFQPWANECEFKWGESVEVEVL